MGEESEPLWDPWLTLLPGPDQTMVKFNIGGLSSNRKQHWIEIELCEKPLPST